MDSLLLVENSKSFGLLLKRRLQNSLGLSVVWARNHAEAVDQLNKAPLSFFMAILDFHLPDAKKGEVVGHVLAKNIPSIVLMGAYDHALRTHILSQGALDFFVKGHRGVTHSIVQFIDRFRKNRTTQVLVVDDSAHDRERVVCALRRYGFSVVETGDSAKALSLAKTHAVHLVLMDDDMPFMNGAHVTKKLRMRYAKDELVVIGLSSSDRPHSAVQFLKAGANDFLLKSFQEEELFWRISQNLEILENKQDLNRFEMRKRAVLEHALDAILTMDARGGVLHANVSAGQLFGYAQADLVGRNAIDLLLPPARRRRWQAWLRWHARYGDKHTVLNVTEEMDCLHADGNAVQVALSLVAICWQEVWQYTAFVHDISGKKQLLISLRETLHAAESSHRLKSDFMANMSHEIRTPMNAVIGFTSLALEINLLPDKARDYLKKAKAASHTLMGILNDMLDFSKIEAGQLTMNTSHFDIHDVCDRLINLFLQKVADKGLELIFLVPPLFRRPLFGDAQRLEQVLINLIHNAVKFTETGVIMVKVVLKKTGDASVDAVFSVQDTGVGVDPVQLPYLFDPFVQADGSTTRKFGGTGLGLNISKSLVEMMGGKIWATSMPGKGSTFFFELPFACPVDTLRALPLLPERLRSSRVLLVDDSAMTRKILRDLLGLLFETVQTAVSGEEAVARLMLAVHEETPYDLVLMDWQLPGMDGVEVYAMAVEQLAAIHPPVKAPKVIMITAFGSDAFQKKAESVGVNAFLDKPVSRNQLFSAVMALFGETVPAAYQPAMLLSHPKEAAARLGGAKALLVDDNAINREIASGILKRVGLIVETAIDGEEAVAKVMSAPFDVVLMDLHMPKMDGYEATRRIRQDARFAALPIFAITAHALVEEQKRCLDVGMNAHVAKPIRSERLYGLLSKWVAPVASAPPVVTKREAWPMSETPLIDQENGLRRVSGDVRLYRRLLLQFYEDQVRFVAEMQQALRAEAWQTASRVAHTVKGVAGNLGIRGLCLVAARLERALKQEDRLEIASQGDLFFASFRAALEPLAALAVSDAAAVSSPSAPCEVDIEGVRPLLTALAGHLSRSSLNTDGVMEAMTQRLASTHAAPALQALQHHMDCYDFEAAETALSHLADTVGLSL